MRAAAAAAAASLATGVTRPIGDRYSRRGAVAPKPPSVVTTALSAPPRSLRTAAAFAMDAASLAAAPMIEDFSEGARWGMLRRPSVSGPVDSLGSMFSFREVSLCCRSLDSSGKKRPAVAGHA